MRLLTFTSPGHGDHLGALVDDDTVLDLSESAAGRPWSSSMLALLDAGPAALAEAGELVDAGGAPGARGTFALRDVTLRAPIPRPRKNVYCVGLNFRSHVEQNARALGQEPEIPSTPLFFSKPVTAVIGPDEPIRLDRRLTAKLDYEVELAMVIGRAGTWIPRAEAGSYIAGYTIVNDVSARDLQFRTSQFLYGKGQDSYAPLGPVVTTVDDMPAWDDAVSELLVNGEVRQQESLANMIFSPEDVVSELSKGITLEPGDIVSLGTPGGCGYQLTPPTFLADGDLVECRVTGIGSLVNRVRTVPGSDLPATTITSEKE